MRIIDYLVVFIFRGFSLISGILSQKQRQSFGRFLAWILKKLSPKRVEITRNNIKMAFPEKSEAEIEKITKTSYDNLGITLAEILASHSIENEEFRKIIKYENIDLIYKKHAEGKGVLLLSGHFGNWEFLAYTAGLFTNIPVNIVVKPQKNKLVDKFINSFRTRHNNNVVSMYKAARNIVNTLRNGGVVALLADQSASKNKDIYVDFFGRPAATFESPAALSLKFDCPMISGFAIRQDDGTYRVKLEEIDRSGLEFDSDGIAELTRRHVAILEKNIRRHPGLWAWQHRRWKHKREDSEGNKF